ncbi:MAG: alpha/beta hydrolase, partial [Spirulina sp. SIO3F2]|nr:alpha/beta hydrolase [Spirulina sp. SIO3F2]
SPTQIDSQYEILITLSQMQSLALPGSLGMIEESADAIAPHMLDFLAA